MNNKTILFALGAVLALPAGDAVAERNGEFGAYAGAHLFNENNELGVVESPDSESLEDSLTFGIRAAFALVGQLDLEGELAISPTKGTESGVDVVAFGWRGHALFHFLEGRFRPFVLAGVGASTASSEDERIIRFDTDFVAHGGVGFKFQVEDHWGARFDARLLLPPSSESEGLTTDAEFFLGLYKEFGTVEKKAEPPPPDEDGDGVPDADDKCVSEAEDMDGNADDDGCPEVEDQDGDKLPDGEDKCPSEAEDMDGFEDGDGCPEADNDGDGIEDSADQCPLEAEDRDGFEDENGCPDEDNDGDGITDINDKCPGEAENLNHYEDHDGCPDEIPDEVKAFSGKIEGIRFTSGAAKIRPSSFKVLDKAVEVLKAHQALRMEVQGHTDNKGAEEVNTKLSQERAQAVVDYFVSKGIEASRLRAKGYGPTKPIADNATNKGRTENRRVEFVLID